MGHDANTGPATLRRHGHRVQPARPGRTLARGAVAFIVATVAFVTTMPSAFAALGFGITASFSSPVTVGQPNIPASLQILNSSTSPESGGNVTVTSITLMPACGIATSGDCPTANADPGVFTVSPTATGEAGTACAGVTFTVAVIDAATGEVQLTPSSTVNLTAPGTSGAQCRLDYTVTVNKAPTHPSAMPAPNSFQTMSSASVTATSQVVHDTATATSTLAIVVTRATPALTTTASLTGATMSDSAVLSSGANPTGTIAFSVFGPNNATCTGAPAFTSSTAVTHSNGTYASATFTASQAGTYRFVAAYSGDANNNAVAGACGAAGESVVVGSVVPALVTHASAPVPVGGTIFDTATLSGGSNPTGTITFSAYSTATCTNAAVFTSSISVSGNGNYSSSPFTTTAAGSYTFVAAYSGDANNPAIVGGCNDANETVQVSKATPAITTTASAPAGGTVADTATLSGGAGPTGAITFQLFGPNNTTCAGAAIFTSVKNVTGNGSYASAPFTVTAPGAYNFRASYAGDANNSQIPLTACGATGENVTVNQGTLTYPTNGQANVDTTKAFTWATVSSAQAYYLIVGTTMYGSDLVNSGNLPPTQSSYGVPTLPAGPTLYATLYTEIGGSWVYQEVAFTAAPGQASLTFPLNGQTGIDPTRPFTWTTIPQAQGYLLTVGTTLHGTDLDYSGPLPASQTSYTNTVLPTGKTLYATLYTEVNGAFSRSQSITFTAGPAMGTFTRPVNGQANVTVPPAFTWTTIAAAQAYYLLVGTAMFGSDVVNSGVLPSSQSTFNVPSLPHSRTLYASLFTEINGNWVVQSITFTSG